MNDPLMRMGTRVTPQHTQADERQVQNSAGGYTFTVSDDARVHRFLTLGTDGGTYYTNESELTKDNAAVIMKAAKTNGVALVRHIVKVSTEGRAPRQNPALFALAVVSVHGDDDARRAALEALPRVARTGTALFTFARYRELFGGWGRGARRAVAEWYTEKPVESVAYQALKYRQRDGWSHRDLLRLTHPKTTEVARRALFSWIVGNGTIKDDAAATELPALVDAFMQAQSTTDIPTWISLIEQHSLSWEMLPDAALNEPRVWDALVRKGMPQTALLRQLPRLTKHGLFTANSSLTPLVAQQLQDTDRLRKGRVHPVNVLVAMKTYAQGRGMRGSLTWTPSQKIVDALDAAFYNAFKAVDPTGKRRLLALDVSGSMTSSASGLPISCREVSAALALVSAATDSNTTIVGFTAANGRMWGDTALKELSISPRRRLDDNVRSISNLSFGGTNCALPMVWAKQNNLQFDSFEIYTDNETWAGRIHPHRALKQYRESSGIQARLAVTALTPTSFTIADPSDPLQLDISGFDSAVPNLLSDFVRGDI